MTDRTEAPRHPEPSYARYPLTPFQRALALETLASPRSGVEILQALVRFTPPRRPDWLGEAWRRVTSRHRILRTSFDLTDVRNSVQITHPAVEARRSLVDTSEFPPDESEPLLERLLQQERRCGFSLMNAPLCRMVILVRNGGAWAVLVSVHHAIVDGWSLRYLLVELAEEYSDLQAGQSRERPAPPPFDRYVNWLRSRKQDLASAFWTRYLDGVDESTPWQWLCHRPAVSLENEVQGRKGYREVRLDVGSAATERLTAAARRAEVSVHTMVRGAWGLVLAAGTGTSEVVFGEVRSLRSRAIPGSHEMIGLLVNPVAVRVKRPSGAPVVDWLVGLHRDWHELRPHAHAAVDQVQSWAATPPSASLFETLLVYDRAPPDGVLTTELGDLPLRVARRPSKPLVLAAWEDERFGLRLGFDRRVEESTAVRLLHRLRYLLESLPATLSGALRDLPVLLPVERQQVLVDWATGSGAEPGVIWLEVARRAEEAPDAIALIEGHRQISFRELRSAAGRLAKHLRRVGVRTGEVIGVEAERTARVIQVYLAVLEAGGAYMPIDPGDPDRRLEEILAAARVRRALAGPSLAARVRRCGVEALDLPAGVGATGAGSPPDDGRLVAGPPSPQDPAYVLLTSGSTGRPKPVVVPHRAVVEFAREPDYIRLSPLDRVLQAAPLCFDASTLEIWGPLLNGAQIVLAGSDSALLDELVETAERERITHLWLTAGLFHALPRRMLERLRGLRYLLAGGDVLSVERCRDVVARLPDTVLINGYGPTEATTFTCCFPVGSGLSADARSVPIGRPIGGMQVYVLDSDMRPVPPGAPGQLWAAGGGVAIGYLGRPTETARAFVPDPWSGTPGSRMYATGDRARFLANGVIEFHGRLDRQVKLLGRRIEPGEIESCLRRHPEVRGAVVTATEGPGGTLRLVAYVVPEGGLQLGPAALLDHLREHLPAHMVPAAVVVLDELPLTRSGKVDRAALPQPLVVSKRSGSRPPTELESRVITIWSDVLGVNSLSPEDDFFDLGGQSLLAMVVLARLREALGAELSLRQVFEAPTVAGMATIVERQRAERRSGRRETFDSGVL